MINSGTYHRGSGQTWTTNIDRGVAWFLTGLPEYCGNGMAMD